MKAIFPIFAILVSSALVPRLVAKEPALGAIHEIQSAPGDSKLLWAFNNRLSGIKVKCSGSVSRKLSDDNDGSRHQRFIVTLDSGQTLLIAHNIDLAPKVSHLRLDDRIKLCGEYVWNAQGGIIHYTHHDPAGIKTGGWIKYRGKTYR